jgi:hypothetical protein
MIAMIVKLAAAVTCIGPASAGIANTQPLPGVEDISDVDETFALNYANDHDREICRIRGRRLTQANPSFYQIYSVIKEVATQGGFNYETAGFVIGAAISASCPAARRAVRGGPGREIA